MDEQEVTVQPAALERKPAASATDGNPGWRVTLYTMWVAQLMAMIGFAFVMPFIPFYIRDELGVSDARMVPIWAGLLGTGSGIMMSVVAPLWGWVADRYGRKLMVQRAMFGGAVILALMAYVRNVHQLFVLRIVQGAFTGTVSASIALISSVVPVAYMGFSLGLMQMSVFTGNSLGPLIGGAVAQRFGYRLPFLVTGGLLFAAGLLVLFGAKERFRRPSAEEHRAAGSIKDILAGPGVIVLLSVYTLTNLSGSLVGPIFPLFVEQLNGAAGRAASLTGIIMAVTGITSAVAAIVVGRMSDRFGHKPVFVICTALTGFTCLPQAAAHSVTQLLIIRAIFGIGAGGMAPAMNAMVASLVPRNRLGQAYGITTTFSALGWAIGPMLGGWAAAALGLRVPFVIMGGMLILLAGVAQKGVRIPSGAGERADAPRRAAIAWQEASDAVEAD
jgi:DHA1 family multidrug resistance protein-like MFS transporter